MEKGMKCIALYIGIIVVVGSGIILTFRGCNKKENPAVDRLNTINDSLYQIIQLNNDKTDSLFAKIDSLAIRTDTIIERHQITNEYYQNETFNILNSTPANADSKFRTTLRKSDSLLKAGFYTRTYNLRSAAFQSELQ